MKKNYKIQTNQMKSEAGRNSQGLSPTLGALGAPPTLCLGESFS